MISRISRPPYCLFAHILNAGVLTKVLLKYVSGGTIRWHWCSSSDTYFVVWNTRYKLRAVYRLDMFCRKCSSSIFFAMNLPRAFFTDGKWGEGPFSAVDRYCNDANLSGLYRILTKKGKQFCVGSWRLMEVLLPWKICKIECNCKIGTRPNFSLRTRKRM